MLIILHTIMQANMSQCGSIHAIFLSWMWPNTVYDILLPVKNYSDLISNVIYCRGPFLTKHHSLVEIQYTNQWKVRDLFFSLMC